MAKNQTVEKKPKVVYNSDGSATVSGVKNMAEASKAVQSSIKQSQEKVRQEKNKTAVDRMWDRSSSQQGVKSSTNQSQKKTRQEAKKTAVDNMWDRQSTPRQRTEEDEAVSALVKARRNTEQKKKELEDYQNTEYDWTDAAARELYEKGQKQKEAEISKAQAEQDAAVANFDRAQMNAMSEEDRGLIDEYIRREDTASDPIDTGTAAIVEHFVNQNAGIDEKRLKQLVETRRRELNAQRMQETQEKAQDEVNDGWMSATWANLKTVPANLISGAMGTMSTIHDLANQDERYSGLDPNSMGNQLNVYSGAVRGQTQQNIVGTEEERAAQIASLVESGYSQSEAEFIVNKGRQGLGALYQAGMSAADTGARAAAGGVLGLGAGFGATVAGLNTFSQTMSDASARGATPEQALALAVTTAGIEAATEKVPLDNLIKVSKGGGAKSLIKNILRQAGMEATEEELSLIGTTLADAAIMQEKSEYNLSVAAYMASGMTEEQAREQANWDLIAEAGETAIVSGIAGGIGGFGASAVALGGNMNTDSASDVTTDSSQEVNAEAVPVAPAVDEGQKIVGAVAAELAQQAPKPEAQPVSPEMEQLDMAIAETLGVQPVQTTDNSAGNKSIKLYRGYNQSDDPTQKNLTSQQSVYNILGREDPNEIKNLLPLAYYTENEEDARSYADMDVRQMDEYRKNGIYEYRDRVMRGKDVEGLSEEEYADRAAKRSFLAMHGREPNAGGKVERYDYTPGKVLDLTELGDMTNVDAAYKVLADKFGIEPSELDNILTMGNNFENDFPAFALLRNTPRDSLGTKIVDLAKKAGYDSIHYSEDGNSHYAIITDRQGWDKNLIKDKGLDYYDEFDSLGADPNRDGVENPLSDRSYSEVGKRSVKAYMYENPAVKPFYQEQALWLLSELADSTKGERTYNDQLYYESGGEKGWSGIKRHTSESIAELLDQDGMSYDQIERGLNAIVNDNGQENNAVSKRIEFVINDRLMNGYTDFYTGEKVPGNAEYLALLRNQQSAPDVDIQNKPTEGGQDENTAAAPENVQEVPKAEQGQQGQDVQSEQPVQSDGSTAGMQNTPSGEVKKSKTFTNTGLRNADEDIRRGYQETLRNDPTAGDYEVKRNADTHATAQERTNSPERVQAEYEYLTAKEGPWTAEDVDTAAIAQKELFKAGEAEKVSALVVAKKKALSNMGQAIQAASIGGTMKEASDPMTACDSAIDGIMKMKEGESTFKAKGGKTYEQWQKDMSTEFTRIAVAIEGVEDGDADGMRDIIRQIARDRKTTAWFGASERMTHNANRILNKLDFDDLKKIANTQLAAMPDDFKRRSKTEIAMGLRKQSMLTSFKTIARNIAGNSAAGFMDSFSDSAGGQFADVLLSKITGKRTVGSDLTRGKEYVNAAKDAMDFASLCVELNIPIETDVDASYAAAAGDGKKAGKYVGKTFRSQGNFAMRALYAYQKYMSYALEVSDKIFEGGTNAAVAESLARINNSGLTDTDIQELAEYTGNRRTFKDATWTDADGEKHGSVLSRKAQDIKKPLGVVGDTAMPFASTPMNVAQAGIDYTVGVGKGITEMAAIVRDAKAGKEISVARQRQAATDFGRGLTGTALIGLFATAAARGIIAVHNDKDKNKKALEQSEGLSGAQINWSAWERDLKGESVEWQDGDVLSSLDFLEPFNTQMYLAVELSKEDTMQDVLKAYPKATFWAVRDAFMDSPMVQGITDIADLLSGLKDAQTPADMGNEIAGYAGDVASSFVPQAVRQAAQVKDGYYRDTRGADAAEYAKNNFLNAIPGASETLPKKVNGFGQEQERLGWVSTFFDPTNTQKYQKNEISGYLEELSGKTGDMSIYPERQAPMKISVNGETIPLTGQQRETYQRTYGEKLEEYYRGLTESGDFDRLTDDQKAEALKQAKEYATQHAKAAVSDFEPVKKAYSEYYAKEITAKQTVDSFTDIFKDGKIDSGKLEDAYQQYDSMSSTTQKQIVGTAGSQARAFLEAREQGVSSEKYASVAENIANVKGTGAVKKDTGKATVRDIDVRQAIANSTGMTDREIDIVMRAYMDDYDPEAKSPETTELKYQYIREELGLSPDEYTSTYRAYLDSSKKAGKIAAIRALGYDYRTAKKLYDVYYGNMKKQLIKMYG